MLKIAKSLVTIYPHLNADLLYAGIALHDLGKTVELSGPVVANYTVEGKLLGHISIAQAMIYEAAKELNIEGIFVCIGQEPNYAYYQNLGLNTDGKGIIVDNNMKTSKEGIYAIGDSVSKDLYQVVNAVSEGAIAAVSLNKELNGR